MSNLSIINRVEEGIIELEANPLAAERFAEFFDASIEALEGIPYRLIKEMQDYRYRIEIAWFAEEDDCISDLPQVVSDLRKWLSMIKREFC